MPQGVQFTNAGTIGEHTFFDYTDTARSPHVTQRVHYAWVTNNGTLDSVTEIFSHELAESCSDPEGNAIQIAPSNPSTAAAAARATTRA